MLNKKDGRSKLLSVFLIIVTILSLAASGYFFMQTKKAQSKNDEAADLKNKISKIINLPDETPVVGTVNDKEKFKDQPFFSGVENGDKLLIFPEAKKAVVYREKDNKLINVGPIAVTAEDSKKTDSSSDISN